MNNVVTNFDQIMEFAKKTGTPELKKRGIVREFLQTKFLRLLYKNSLAKKLSFVGGTSLRLLRGLDRFSEDLDFDNLGLSNKKIVELVEGVVDKFLKENVKVELKKNIKDEKTYFELRFPKLLYDLKISSNPKEKLMIKIDYSNIWKDQETEVVLLDRYGLMENIVTNNLDQMLVQKLTAFTRRNRVQPRDIYDIVWLYSLGARLDKGFMNKNGLEDLVKQARKRLKKRGVKEGDKRRLRPFLFKEDNVSKLDLFESVLKKIEENSLAGSLKSKVKLTDVELKKSRGEFGKQWGKND